MKWWCECSLESPKRLTVMTTNIHVEKGKCGGRGKMCVCVEIEWSGLIVPVLILDKNNQKILTIIQKFVPAALFDH